MINLPIVELLALWSELEAAYYGENGFGGDTAEIYAYRLQRFHHRPELGDIFKSILDQQKMVAAASMCNVIERFIETHPDIDVYVNGEKYKPSLKESPFEWRWHIKISKVTKSESGAS
jgi:hypothetical protein